MSAFAALTWMLALAWLAHAIAVVRGMRRLVDLAETDAGSPASLTGDGDFDLTVVVPACNEEKTIGAALASLAASTGIRLQIVAVDDRSTDQTGAIMDHAAFEHRSGPGPHLVEVLHIRDLPAGWLGKTHAMQRAAEHAKAPWLLFTDADVVFAPEALQRVTRCALAMQADHFVLVPSLIFHGVSESAMLASIHALTQWITRYWKVADPRARDFLGVGGFNMVRADVFRSLGGFAPLRMEVIEDMSLGWMVKRAGYRSCVATGPGLAQIRWLAGPFSIVSNIEKNGFAGFRYKSWLCLAACLGILIDAVLPLAAMAMGGAALAAGITIYASLGVIFHANRKVLPIHPLAVIFFAPCLLVLCFAFLRSMLLTLGKGGITWRGTRYPLSELRKNAAPWN
ncbi:MAG: glycosyltransferase [Terracidiphilus sp.]